MSSADERPVFVQAKEEKYFRNPPDSVDLLKEDMLKLNEKQLYRAPSTLIPEAGLGLFSKVPIKKGRLITWYSGVYVSKSEYADLKQKDDRFRDYAQALDAPGRQVVIANYRRDAGGNLKMIPFPALERAYYNDGAMQFINGKRWYDDPDVNVASIVVVGKNRKIRQDSPDLFGELERAIKNYPNEIIRVAVATRDIPANTELIIPYGDSYFDILAEEAKAEGTSSQYDSDEESNSASVDLSGSSDEESNSMSVDLGSISSDESESSEPPRKKARYQCLACNRNALFQCSACKTAHYCSTNCQAKSWSSSHRTLCSRLENE